MKRLVLSFLLLLPLVVQCQEQELPKLDNLVSVGDPVELEVRNIWDGTMGTLDRVVLERNVLAIYVSFDWPGFYVAVREGYYAGAGQAWETCALAEVRTRAYGIIAHYLKDQVFGVKIAQMNFGVVVMERDRRIGAWMKPHCPFSEYISSQVLEECVFSGRKKE